MKLLKKILVITFIIALVCIIKTTCFATTAIVNTDTLKLRKEASTDCEVLELLSQNQELEVIEQSGDWYKIKYKQMVGYVHKDYIKVKEETVNNENTVENTITTNQEEPTEPQNENNNNQNNNENTIPVNTSVKLIKDTKVYILPLINSSEISSITKDSEITIISRTNGWYYIQSKDINGWIRKEALLETTIQTQEPENTNKEQEKEEEEEKKPEDTQIEETAIKEKVLYVNSPSVYVRKGPATTYEVVDSLILNNQVTAIAESGDWYKVKVDGKEGYIAKRLLSATEQEETSRGTANRQETSKVEENNNQNNGSTGEEIASFAQEYLGCPYVYGASGPSKFDCSGFTMFVYKNFGISLSHSATAQSKCGIYVEKEDLQAGDLVFFTDYETGYGIGHVGIYIGNGNFIHASSGTGYCVKISTLLSGSYYNRYETARRLV